MNYVTAQVYPSWVLRPCRSSNKAMVLFKSISSVSHHQAAADVLRGALMPGPSRSNFTRSLLRIISDQSGFTGKSCMFAEQMAYHLTTFLEGGGMVTAMSFTGQNIDFKRQVGWWPNTYCRVVKTGRTRSCCYWPKVARRSTWQHSSSTNHHGGKDGQTQLYRK